MSVRLSRLVQLMNALSPMRVTESGIFIFFNFSQSLKALGPIVFKEAGDVVFVGSFWIFTSVRFLHCQKALSPMVSTEAGIVILSRLEQL